MATLELLGNNEHYANIYHTPVVNEGFGIGKKLLAFVMALGTKNVPFFHALQTGLKISFEDIN